MDKELVVALLFLSLPALPALVNGSFAGAIFAAIIGAGGIFLYLQSAMLGVGVYIAAWLVAWAFGAAAGRRRRADRQHRELIRAIRAKKAD